MYSPVRQVSQSPHSYKHDDNIYTSRSRHEHVMQRIDIPPPIHKFNYKQVGPFRHKVTHKPQICVYIYLYRGRGGVVTGLWVTLWRNGGGMSVFFALHVHDDFLMYIYIKYMIYIYIIYF